MISARLKILVIPVTHGSTVTGLFTPGGSKHSWTCRWHCWCLLLPRDEEKKKREPSPTNWWHAPSVSQGVAEVSPTSKSVGTTETEDTRISIILESVCVCVCARATEVQGSIKITIQNDVNHFSPPLLDIFIFLCCPGGVRTLCQHNSAPQQKRKKKKRWNK